jgi:hypothetical protein
MWFWCDVPFGWMWWIFPIMFLLCLVMMFFCMRMFFGGHFGNHFRCCSPRRDDWRNTLENDRPPRGTQPGETDDRREQR